MDQPQQNPQNNITSSQVSRNKWPYLIGGGIIGLLLASAALVYYFFMVTMPWFVDPMASFIVFPGPLLSIVFSLFCLVSGLLLGWFYWYIVTKPNPQNGITPSVQQNWFYVVMGIVLLLVFGAGVWWYVSLSIPPQESKKETASQDQTANWKTYRNEKYGFEMKIPPEISKLDWHVSEKVYVGGSVFYGAVIFKPFVSLDIQVPDFHESPRDITLFTVYIFSNQDAINKQMNEYIPGVTIFDQPPFSFDKVVRGMTLTFAFLQRGFQDCKPDLCILLPLREKMQDSLLDISGGGDEIQLSDRQYFRNDIARIEFDYPISWPAPVTPPNRAPYNLSDYEMKSGNTFFTGLVGNAYIEFTSMVNATSRSLSLEEKLKNFDPKGSVKTNKNSFRYIIYTAETERAGKTTLIEFEDKYNIGYNVSFVIPATEYDLRKTEWESVVFSLNTF